MTTMIEGRIIQIMPATYPAWAVQRYDDGTEDALRIHAYALIEGDWGHRTIEPLALYHYGLDACPGDYLELRGTGQPDQGAAASRPWWKFWK